MTVLHHLICYFQRSRRDDTDHPADKENKKVRWDVAKHEAGTVSSSDSSFRRLQHGVAPQGEPKLLQPSLTTYASLAKVLHSAWIPTPAAILYRCRVSRPSPAPRVLEQFEEGGPALDRRLSRMLPLLVAAVPTSPAISSCDLGSGPMMQLMGISSGGDLGNAGIGR
jgi:hypothetical protein